VPNLNEWNEDELVRSVTAPHGTDPHGGPEAKPPPAVHDDERPAPVHSWRALAACAGHPVEWWYVEGGSKPDNLATVERARAICHACPVDVECLAHAVTWPEAYGMWGGYTPKRIVRFRTATREPSDWRLGEPGAALLLAGTATTPGGF